MNIFYLDKDPVIAAQMMCDKHVVKMILESAQLLSTAHRVLDGDVYADSVGLYKTAHKNHPSTIWTRASVHNYMWLYNHMISLMQEYTCRYGKHHASERLVAPLRKTPTTIPVVDFSDPPQCMPDYCKTEDTVSAYRYYYINEKASFAKWKNAKIPEWFNVGAAA
jgi:hypothetical protein